MAEPLIKNPKFEQVAILAAGMLFFGAAIFAATRVYKHFTTYRAWPEIMAQVTDTRYVSRRTVRINYRYELNNEILQGSDTLDEVTYRVGGYSDKDVLVIRIDPANPNVSSIPVFPWIDIAGTILFIPFGLRVIRKGLNEANRKKKP